MATTKTTIPPHHIQQGPSVNFLVQVSQSQSIWGITMGIFSQAANVVQKGTVLGLMSLFGYQIYQIGYNVMQDRASDDSHARIMAKISKQVEEESKFQKSIDKIPDRYDREDNSYLERVPNLQDVAKRP